MNQLQTIVSVEELAFERLKEFHLQRVKAVEGGRVPLSRRSDGILVLHLIPEHCALARTRLDGSTLKQYGQRIRPLGDHGGYTRFNVDGFLICDSHPEVRSYSQLFWDGRLESMMSDVGYQPDPQLKNCPHVIRCALLERAMFSVVKEYLRFCRDFEFAPPVWLFSALVDCNGFRILTDRVCHDLSRTSVDRSPAVLPDLKIHDFEAPPEQLLQPWCDSLWQAAGLERSFNFDNEGNWHEPR